MEENLKWLIQLRRLFLLSLIYDIAFLDPFTTIRHPNPITGLIGIIAGSIVYIISINYPFLEKISFAILIVSTIWVIIASFRRKPIYVLQLDRSMKIIEEKGLKLNNIEDLEHAKAIIEYSLFMSQKAKDPNEMKFYLDIAYDTWFKIIKAKSSLPVLSLFKKYKSRD